MPSFVRMTLTVLAVSEIVAFVWVASALGFLGALGLMVVGFFIGVLLLRVHGMTTALRLQAAMTRGELPPGVLFDAGCGALAGLLLVIPGFVTDVLAFLLLVPPARALMKRGLARVLRPVAPPPPPPGQGPVIDGDFVVVEDETGEPNRPPRDELPRHRD